MPKIAFTGLSDVVMPKIAMAGVFDSAFSSVGWLPTSILGDSTGSLIQSTATELARLKSPVPAAAPQLDDNDLLSQTTLLIKTAWHLCESMASRVSISDAAVLLHLVALVAPLAVAAGGADPSTVAAVFWGALIAVLGYWASKAR